MSLLTFQSLGRRSACFPEGRDCYSPKANEGHLVAAVKLDGRGSHVGVGCDSNLLKKKW